MKVENVEDLIKEIKENSEGITDDGKGEEA